MMNEWLEIYWAVFFIGRDFVFILMAIFFWLGILRPIKLYAFAQPIIIDKDWIFSSFLIRTGWRIAIHLNILQADPDIRNPYGAHLYGTGVDIGITLFVGIILSWLWPVIVIITLGYFPLQIMHVHYARKKEFMARLKGEIVT